jgi:hypothetical protein
VVNGSPGDGFGLFNFPIIVLRLSSRGGKPGVSAVLPRCGVTESLVNALVVLVVYPLTNGVLQLVEIVAGTQVDPSAFERTLQSRDEDVIQPLTATIQAQPASFGLHRHDPLLAGEAVLLVGVEDD